MTRHHYVPQFYLRRFGAGNHIAMVLLDYDFRFVEKAKIKGQSWRPDYYRFPEVENSFSLIEGIASHQMQKISSRIPLTADDIVPLKLYLALQMIRTPATVRAIESHLSAGLSSVFATYPDLGGSRGVSLPIKIPDAEVFLWRNIDAVGVVNDLELRFLFSKRETFLTSDQPVAVYNPWALKGGFARNGLGCRGLMLFLPISSRICIMLYDSAVYSIRSRDRRSAFITLGRNDEERLNKLQMVGNRGVLYLPHPDRHPEIQSLARKVRDAYPAATNTPTVRWATSEDGESKVFEVHEQPIDFGDWTFLYVSKDWREVPHNARGYGVYGTRDSTPDGWLRMLSNTHPWNSTRYTDEDGNISYLRNHL